MSEAYQVKDNDTLLGPNHFECRLTDPEDRIFTRDLEPVVLELNRLYIELQMALGKGDNVG